MPSVHRTYLPGKTFTDSQLCGSFGSTLRGVSPPSRQVLRDFFIEKGPLLFHLNGKETVLETGDILILNKGTKHCTLYSPQVPKRYFVMVFDLKEMEDSHGDDPAIDAEVKQIHAFKEYIQDRPFALTKDAFDTGGCINKLEKEAINKDVGWEFIVRSHYTNFVILAMRNFIDKPEPDNGLHWNNLPIAITKYLHANYSHPISIQEVADHFHITSRHVTRVFKDYFGTSLAKTLTIYRINYAKNYLQDTDYSLEQIAEKIGFASASSLSTLFKEIEGMSITQYRKLIAAHNENEKNH